MGNFLKKLGIDRKKNSPENCDQSFKNIDTSLSNLGTDIETRALKGNVEGQTEMLATINDLLPKYQSLKSGIRSAEGSWATKRQLEHRLNENIQDLKRMEKDLSKHTYTNLTTYKSRLGELIYYYQHYEQVRQIATLGGRTSDIHTIIDSKQDAKRAKRYEKSDAKYQQEMNAILHDTALVSLWNNDMERYEEYLEAVVNGQVEPSSHPFYKAHAQSFKLISCTNPDLYKMLAPSGRGKVQYMTASASAAGAGIYSGSRRIGQRESFISRAGKSLGEIMSSFPSIEQDPRKKQAWEQLGSVVAFGGAIFMGIKVLQNVFSSKEKNPNKRGKAAGRGAALYTLTNSDRIINWFEDISGWHPSEKIKATNELFQTYGFKDSDAQRIAETYIGAPVATLSALHFIPIYELSAQNIVEYKNNQFSFNYDNYQKYVEALDLDPEQKNTILAAGQRLRDENSIDAGLRCFYVNNPSDLTRMAGGDTNKTLANTAEVQNGRKDCVDNVSCGVNSELAAQGLKAANPEAITKIMDEYNQNGGIKIKRNEMNKLIIKWMKEGLVDVNDPDKKYELEDMLKDNNIDLEKKTIKGFTNTGGTEIEFKSYKELFNAVNLTNFIKKNFRGRDTNNNNNKPFHIDPITGRIEFDDTQWYKVWKNETDVAKMRTIKGNTTLRNNYQFYINYLNEWRVNGGRNKVS